jgi:hypothetical protein
VLRAPLVLVPVELTRKSARAGYQLRATDDDPLVNPALAEYLAARRAYGFPDLPDAGTLGDGYDLQQFLAETAAAVGDRPRWAVKTDAVLALFSFQKFVMYKDLEANAAPLAAHRLVRQLVTRQADAGAPVVGLPDDVRRMDLDAEYPPERTFQVVDADASQLRAIAAAARGHDLVIEGPPGTGKSQTITNLIAQALAADRRVLFVAEKMAALSVVHARLVAAGLGEFCLELHSTKANKRAVMRALGAALDASLQGVAAPTTSTERLPAVRAALPSTSARPMRPTARSAPPRTRATASTGASSARPARVRRAGGRRHARAPRPDRPRPRRPRRGRRGGRRPRRAPVARHDAPFYTGDDLEAVGASPTGWWAGSPTWPRGPAPWRRG